jgi:hypothetical protein
VVLQFPVSGMVSARIDYTHTCSHIAILVCILVVYLHLAVVRISMEIFSLSCSCLLTSVTWPVSEQEGLVCACGDVWSASAEAERSDCARPGADGLGCPIPRLPRSTPIGSVGRARALAVDTD